MYIVHCTSCFKVLLGAMDCTDPGNKGTCQTYEVQGYPTLMYFQYGKITRYLYAESRVIYMPNHALLMW